MSFILGFLGALLALAAFVTGWISGGHMAKQRQEKRAATEERKVGEEERRRLKSEQDAFRTLLNYNSDMAYGLNMNDYVQADEGEARS